MARGIKQFRYYAENSSQNSPLTGDASTTASLNNFANGNVFRNANIFPVVKLGVQAMPGTKIYLNNSIDPVIIGVTGIYELDVEDQAEIVSITVDSTSLAAIQNSDGAGFLIIDVLYNI